MSASSNVFWSLHSCFWLKSTNLTSTEQLSCWWKSEMSWTNVDIFTDISFSLWHVLTSLCFWFIVHLYLSYISTFIWTSVSLYLSLSIYSYTVLVTSQNTLDKKASIITKKFISHVMKDVNAKHFQICCFMYPVFSIDGHHLLVVNSCVMLVTSLSLGQNTQHPILTKEMFI